jgi:hypothetical protein
MSTAPSSRKPNAGHSSSADEKSDNPKKDTSKKPLTLTEQIMALHKSFKRRRKAHRKAVRSDIVKAVDIGLALKKNKKQWKDFCENAWGTTKPPKEDQIDQAVRYAIKYMVGPGEAAQKKASFYYNAVATLVEKGLRGKALKKRLKTDGLKTLAAEHANSKKGKKEDGDASQLPEENNFEKKSKAHKAAKAESDKKTEKARDLDQPNRAAGNTTFTWEAVMKCKNSKASPTHHKEGEKIKITATIEKVGVPLMLLVHKVKRVVPSPDRG